MVGKPKPVHTPVPHVANTAGGGASSSSSTRSSSSSVATAASPVVAAISFAADIIIVVGTAPGWIVQLREILFRGTAAGFSWQTALLLLSCYTLRVGYYFGAHYHFALLLQCLVMIVITLALIAAIADAPDSEGGVGGRVVLNQDELAALQDDTNSGDDDDDHHDSVAGGRVSSSGRDAIELESLQHGSNKQKKNVNNKSFLGNLFCSFKKAASRRWAGGRVYFGIFPWGGINTKFVYSVYMLTLTIVCVIAERKLPKSKALTNIVGFIALGVEASVTLPQVILCERNRSVEGLSKFLVGTWFVGDLTKTLYFVAKEQPMPFVMCGTAQFLIDIFIVGQFMRFGKKNGSADAGGGGGGGGSDKASVGGGTSAVIVVPQKI